MSQQQPVSDKQTQPQATSSPGDDRVQYPDVSSREQKVESEPVGEHLHEAAGGQERPLGTDVMGDPVKPDDQQTRSFDTRSDGERGEPVVGKQNPYVQQPESSGAPNQQAPGANPYVQQPEPSGAPNQQAPGANPYVQQPETTGSPNQQAQGANPYVQPSSAENAGKTPMDSLQDVFSKWTKKAEGFTGNAGSYWTHLSTGSNMTETALGRLSAGTKVVTGGGLANVFKKTFPPVSDKEQLLKTYACYLSTSTGPVAGTIFLSTERMAFVSDSPLSLSPNSGGRPKGEQSGHYYKVAIPLSKVQAVNPAENPKKTSEKYIQVETSDNHEFWFMGFISYDKAVTNLQEAVKKGENVNNKSDISGSAQSPHGTAPPQPGVAPSTKSDGTPNSSTVASGSAQFPHGTAPPQSGVTPPTKSDATANSSTVAA